MDNTAGKLYLASIVLTLLLFLGEALPKNIKDVASKGHTQKIDADDKALHGEPVTILGDEGFLEFNDQGAKTVRKQSSSNAMPRKTKSQGPKVKGFRQKNTDKRWKKKDASHSRKSSVRTCVPVSIQACLHLDLYPLSQFPNHLGHNTEAEAVRALAPYMPLLKDSKCADAFRKFACLLYAPQCSGTDEPLLPCRSACETAKDGCAAAMGKMGLQWPNQWNCGHFNKDGLCVDPYIKITPVPEPKLNKHSEKKKKHEDKHSPVIQSQAPKADRPIKSHLPKPRNYNIRQLGQSELFQGWADVQGQGAANDYCRVIGTNPSSWFLSCSLGGSTQSDHIFVSRRGFDVGHRRTWFMKDGDGDGKDDYCRCVGKGLKSYVSCMKAGEFGFFGSPQQPGSEYSFTMKTDAPCFHKNVNPFFGI